LTGEAEGGGEQEDFIPLPFTLLNKRAGVSMFHKHSIVLI